MKKTIGLLLAVFLFAGITTANAMYSFADLKNDISDNLNNTVVVLKNYFKKTDEELKKDKVIVKTTKEQAEAIKNSSAEKETNPVVLKHGAVNMPVCNTNTEELSWNGNAWVCNKPKYGTDCYPAKGETRVNNGDGTFKCVQAGSYTNVATGLGACDGTERRTQVACMFTNNKTGQQYQVNNGCSNGVQRYRQACGPNGANSRCKCPADSQYVWNGSSAYCKTDLEFSGVQSDMKAQYSNDVLTWGTFQDNYWKSACGEFKRTLYVDYNSAHIMSVKLIRAAFDDYIWIRVNGHLVFAGPDNQADFSHIKQWSPMLVNGRRAGNCERGTSWNQYPNRDITRFFKNGRNKIEMIVVVADEGEGAAQFRFQKRTQTMSTPVCPM